jgi:hypothetical protein
MVAYVRTVKTASGATAVQIVYSSRRGSRDIEHIGSAHDEAELAALKAAARQRLAAGQPELDLGLEVAAGGGPLPITSSWMGHLWGALGYPFRLVVDRDVWFGVGAPVSGWGAWLGGWLVVCWCVRSRLAEP